MTITDYLINAMFLLVVARQARERELDHRSIVVPLVLIFFVAQMYLHSIPTAGNDLVLIGLLAAIGLTFGIASGFATHVRAGDNGLAIARVGWLAAGLLIAGSWRGGPPAPLAGVRDPHSPTCDPIITVRSPGSPK